MTDKIVERIRKIAHAFGDTKNAFRDFMYFYPEFLLDEDFDKITKAIEEKTENYTCKTYAKVVYASFIQCCEEADIYFESAFVKFEELRRHAEELDEEYGKTVFIITIDKIYAFDREKMQFVSHDYEAYSCEVDCTYTIDNITERDSW